MTSTSAAEPILEISKLYAGYGDLAAVRDLDMIVHRGEIVALLGPNGAGKTTTLLTLAGVLPMLSGSVLWEGREDNSPLHRRVRKGLGFIPEERSIIYGLTVRENLRLGRGSIDDAVSLFPELGALMNRSAGLLSGGEQQMLTLARCLASKPSMLLVDELSVGLAPIIVKRLLVSLRDAARQTGTSVLMVEQEVQRALSVADRWYLLRHGSLVASGVSDETSLQQLAASYL
jgi:branched-chain amino acid transport system ATP-binding protein